MLPTRGNYRANAIAAADALSKQQGGPGYSGVAAQNTADAQKAVQKDFTSGKAAQTITAFNTASGHLDHLDSLVGALGNGNVQLFNQLGNDVAKELGITAPSNFEAVKTAVAGEVSKTFTGNVATDSEIGHVTDILKSAQSPQQLHGAITQIRSLLDSKKQALQGQYKEGMGGQPNFNPSSSTGRKVYNPNTGKVEVQG
jgi:hypothetical protein